MTNSYEVFGSAVRMEVWYKNQQMFCWFDTSDLPVAQTHTGLWYANPARAPKGKFYVMAKFWDRETKSSKSTMFHRVLLGLTDPNIEGHHKDNNGLNNRRLNLEACSHVRNMRERFQGRDWDWLDKAREDRDEYRVERKIAADIQQRFELTRQGLWKIRSGITRTSKAARAYSVAIEAAGIRTFEQLSIDRPKDGKWGVATSGVLRAPSV